MNNWGLRQCYGKGAGKILLSIPVRQRASALSSPELRADLPGAGLASLVMLVAIALALGDRTPGHLAATGLTIVLLEDAPESSIRRPHPPESRVARAFPPEPPALRPEPQPPVRTSPPKTRPRVEPRPVARTPIQIDRLRSPSRPSGASAISVRRGAVETASAAPASAAPGFDLPVASLPAARVPISTQDRLVRGAAGRSASVAIARISPSELALPGLRTPAAVGAGPDSSGPAPVAAAPPGRDDLDDARDTALRGVPLGALAGCRSDRREDRLKQRVIAAARSGRQCASDAGTYRFVETRNLNAFLLWVERNPARAEVDRCAELELALACLAGPALREVETP